MFSTAREVLARESETHEREDEPLSSRRPSARDAASNAERFASTSRASCAPNDSIVIDDDDARTGVDADGETLAARAKRVRIERAERKRAEALAKPKQASLVTMFSNAARGANAAGRTGSGALSRDVIQRILTYVPVSSYGDARLVCAAWRDAIDDDAFMPFVKMNRALALSADAKATRDAEAAVNDLTERKPGHVGLGPLVRYIAIHRPFKSRLTVDALCRFVEEDEYLTSSNPGPIPPAVPELTELPERYDFANDWRFWLDAETRTSRSFLGTVGDICATIREIGKFEMVQAEVRGVVVTSGWAVLALTVAHVAENEFVASRILRAARHALRADLDSDFAEEDLTEFIHLLVAYLRSSHSSLGATRLDDNIEYELLRMKARVVAANDYADLHDERDWSGRMPGSSGMPGELKASTRLTHEQEAIVSTSLKPPQWMVVHAFAGSGKTTTLVEYAKRYPMKRFLYLAFNKAITEEAKSRFPPNTDAKTFHGLAYGLATWYKQGGKKLNFGDKLRSADVARALGKSVHDRCVGRGLVTLNNYLISADDDIGAQHVPSDSMNSREEILQVARTLWSKMKQRDNNDIPLTHAGYMKLYQLQRPRLDIDMSRSKNKTGYDVILLDEAQDVSPVMFDIVRRQEFCAKIIVGDANQQIYNFTGAMNVMNTIDTFVPSHLVTHRCLVRSFRFGMEIATVANAILNVKRERSLVIGARPTSLDDKCVFLTSGIATRSMDRDVDGAPPALPIVWIGKGDVTHPFEREKITVLVRSNASLVCALFYILSAKENWPDFARSYEYARRLKIHVIGGVEALKLNQVLDFVRLIEGDDLESIQDKYIRGFVKHGAGNAPINVDAGSRPDNAMARIIDIATNQDDFETLQRIAVAQQYRSRLFTLVERLKMADVGSNDQVADFIITTAHKSKGLEFDNVMLWDDFEDIESVSTNNFIRGPRTYVKTESNEFFGGFRQVEISVDEINLTYVAVTRAKKRVFLSKQIAPLLMHCRANSRARDPGLIARGPRELEYYWFPSKRTAVEDDRGLAPFVLRYVDLSSGERPNRLSWNPVLDHHSVSDDGLVGIHRGDNCSICCDELTASSAFVFTPRGVSGSGLVCVADRGVEARNTNGRDVGITERHTPDAFHNAMRDIGHVRLDIDFAKDGRFADASAPAIYVLENPAYTFRVRTCRNCFYAGDVKFTRTQRGPFTVSLARQHPLTETLAFERALSSKPREATSRVH